ncbi:MAG: cation:proton antiporter [Hydrogenophaga sp.]|uniref:cation:proton antiporter n=1 Tax=Hydrogenophaga sp. TaxID=1904254 RepID=UPI002734EFD6|nr:cation:proton antiporter family protein [Hydrogenophaga sp.]MDP3347062.1 cation:proton antiporter [Hydrogenophaga sp.]MDP3806459.1 cation:proton antiporter [Hydrogenophaga sp.]MDP3925568.1 cation:proton antiporter [Hydrogenophaga sp.]
MHGPFAEFAILLLICALAGAVFVRLRQPVLIAYIVVGVVVGPAVLGLVTAHDQIDLLAQVGVAVLLFAVGLKLDLHHIRHIGPVALATGLGQLAFTIVIGFAIILALGRDVMDAIYVAVALTFSSTIIIVKLLSDKRELDSLHGRIAVGFLIVQDLAVVIAMMAMSALRGTGDAGSDTGLLDVALSLGWRLSLAAVLMYVLMRWVLPLVVASMARSQELLLVFAIAWGVALAALGEWAGFSKEAGAFMAGFSLASTPYREAMNARLTGIRDFLLLFFFIDLGAKLDFSTLGAEVVPALVLSAFVLIGNPLIVMAIMGYMGYRKRTGFMAGLTVAQISEFSIVFVAMGITLGHIGVQALGLTTLVGLITITLSTYMILYSQPLYERLAPWLGVFERKNPFREIAAEQQPAQSNPAEVIVFGLGRYGSRLLLQLRAAGIEAVGVDFDPEAVRELQGRGLPVYFGDGEDADFLESLPLKQARWVITSFPQWESNRALLHALQSARYNGQVAGVVRDAAHGRLMAEAGIQRIFNPFDDAADHAAERLAQDIRHKEHAP